MIPASTGGSSVRSRAPASTAGRAARPGPRSARTCASTRPRRRRSSRVPGVQALPPGRDAGVTGVEPAGRSRRAGDAAHRRRCGRSRGRRRARAAGSDYSERHLHRQLVAEVGAGPIALARAQRAQTARVLIETTDVAFAHDRVRERLREHPPVQRHGARGVRDDADRAPDAAHARGRAATPLRAPPPPGTISVRLPFRAPLDAGPLLDFLRTRAVPGVESVDADHVPPDAGAAVRRRDGRAHSPPRPHRVHPRASTTSATCPAAVQRCRRLLDLDADPVAVSALLETRPAPRPAGAQAPRAAGPRPRRRLRAAGPRDRRPAGVRRRRPHRPRADHRGIGERAARGARRRAHPCTSRRGRRSRRPTRRRSRCRARGRRRSQRVATAAAAGDLLVDPGADRDELRAPAARHPRDRTLDGRLRGPPRARRSRTPSCRRTSGSAARSSSSGSPATARGRGRPGRVLAPLALVRPHAPLDEPRGLTNTR